MSYSVIKFRRGSLFEWSQVNPRLAEGEFIVEYPDDGIGTGLCKFKVGDGSSKFNDLPYCLDATAATKLTGGSVDSDSSGVIQIRADTQVNWETINPVIGENEYVFSTDVKGFKMGDGKTKWSKLPYLEFGSEWDNQNRVVLNYGDEG